MTPRFDTLFFDLDGTLIDSAPDIRDCLAAALVEQGYSPEVMDGGFRLGPPLEIMIRRMLPDIAEENLKCIVASFRKRYDVSDYPMTASFPGIDSLLIDLTASGCNLFVATNKPLLPTRRIVERMGWCHFTNLLCPDAFQGSRLTKAQLLKRALSDYGGIPSRCMMIGDLPDDIEAAKAAGITSVAVAWGYGEITMLSDCGADWIAHTPSDIISLVKGDANE
jgi:phosphoglycolate phosphatase